MKHCYPYYKVFNSYSLLQMADEKVLWPQAADAVETATPEEEKVLGADVAPVEEAPKKKASKKKVEKVEEPEELKDIEAGNVQCTVTEVTPPPIEPMDLRPFAEIGWKKYYIDSDNSDLLEDVVGGKEKNPTTGQWEDKMFKYLPAKHIYTLMDALFDTYDFKSEPMKFTWEEYVVTKKKYNNSTKKWEDAQETMRVYEKTVRIVTTVKVSEYENVVRETVGYAQWVAWLGILTNDSARNGFANKLAFRARKEALKNLWKVFRTYDYEDENEFVAEETTGVAGKAIAEVAEATGPVAQEAQKQKETSNEAQEWREAIAGLLIQIKDFFTTGAEFTEEELTKAMFAVKADLWIDATKKVAMDEFKKIYNELKEKAKK